MDPQDESKASEWKPFFPGVSEEQRSTSLSSVNTISNLIHTDVASVDGSDHGSGRVDHTGASYRNLAPRETFACQSLTEEIISISRGVDLTSSADNTTTTRAIESVLGEAALTIQYNAKWFAEGQLSRLLQAALDSVASSNSSQELFAIIALIETISTYSYFPQTCLDRVVCFIAQTYYGSTRAVKTRKLASTARHTLQKLLASHVGSQCISILLGIMCRADDYTLQTQLGYAQVAGALQLLTEHFKLGAHVIPLLNVPNFVGALLAVSHVGAQHLGEHVLEALNLILHSSDATYALDEALAWDLVLETVESCVEDSRNCFWADTVVDGLIDHADRFEPRHIRTLALVATTVKKDITPELARGLTDIVCLLHDWNTDTASVQLEQSLDALGRSRTTFDVFERLLEKDLPGIINIAPAAAIKQLVMNVEKMAGDPETPNEAINLLSKACRHLLDQSISQNSDFLDTMFGLCCTLSIRCRHAAKAILRTRADTELALYLEGVNDGRSFATISSFQPLHKLDIAILSAMQASKYWTVYDSFSSRLAIVLTNHSLFETRIHVIKELRAVICQQLKSSSYTQPPENTGLNKSYVVKNLIQALTTIVTYHKHLTKQELVEMISIFLDTSGMRDDAVSVTCIHALTVCCYELPITMSSYMDDVIDKMAKMVTKKLLAIYVLQFFAGLSRLPELFRNFKEHDYKKIFGICGSYLQSIRGTSALEPSPGPGSQDITESEDMTDELPQYVYALAHHVICFWYIAIRSSDRKPLKSYITTCLRYQTSDGQEKIEDQGLVTLDLMDAMDASDEDGHFEVDVDESEMKFESQNTIAGTILTTRYTARGHTIAITDIRRPSGRWKRRDTSISHELNASQLAHELSPMANPGQPKEPLALRPCVELDRAIQMLDRVPGLDSHKAGLIYVGENQKDEFTILQNSSGSPDFWQFIALLGEPRRLRGAKFNTHGLDRENDLDGTTTVVWENALTQLVFHITPLMPKQSDSIVNKKKHIGNDAVNIIFNNSGRPFQFETLPTQVTHAYIVITPSDRTSFLQARRSKPTSASSSLGERFYKVHVLTRSGYPSVSPVGSEKIVSGSSLPSFIRNLALNECIFALMWDHRHEAAGEFPSSWRARLRQLRLISERYAERPEAMA